MMYLFCSGSILQSVKNFKTAANSYLNVLNTLIYVLVSDILKELAGDKTAFKFFRSFVVL